jgi:hypothetical protein
LFLPLTRNDLENVAAEEAELAGLRFSASYEIVSLQAGVRYVLGESGICAAIKESFVWVAAGL